MKILLIITNVFVAMISFAQESPLHGKLLAIKAESIQMRQGEPVKVVWFAKTLLYSSKENKYNEVEVAIDTTESGNRALVFKKALDEDRVDSIFYFNEQLQVVFKKE